MNADNEGCARNSGAEKGESLPYPGEQVLVQCEGFRKLAYRDAKGKWKTVGPVAQIQKPTQLILFSRKERTEK